MIQGKTRISFGDIQRELGREFSRDGRPLGRSYLDRIIRDHPELAPAETVAGSRQWALEAMQSFRNAILSDREKRRW